MDIHSLDPERLVTQAGALQRLARQLVRDSHAADDAAQDAWVAALERPPRATDALGAWLRTAARNLGRNAARATRRRRQREHAAARHEAQDPSESALERAETARRLAELVAALPEPQRTVLVLRYYEGLAPGAIAERLRVPVKTVKTRHTRALAALRARLDELSGGDRSSWLAALAPLARRSGPSAGAWALVAAAVLVVAPVLVRLSLLEAPALPEVAHEPAARMPEASTTAEVAAAAAREPAESASSRAGVPRAARLTGSVLREEDGAPVADVLVRLRLEDGGTRRREELRTDAAGRFALEWTGPVTLESVEVGATATTAATRLAPYERIAVEDPGVARELELRVGRGATLEGVVLGPDRVPLAGASVLAWCATETAGEPDRRATSDAAGRFRLEHLGADFRVVAEAPGLVCAQGLRGEVASGVHGEGLELLLAEPRTFRGVVTDEAGRPIAGARLAHGFGDSWSSRDVTTVPGVLRWGPARMEGFTDAAGRFELGPHPRAETGVRVTHPDHLWEDFVIAADADTRLVLRSGRVLSGRVTGADGGPVAGATVRIDSGADARTVTDAEGRFVLRPLADAENAFVHVRAVGHALLAVQPVRVGPGATEWLELVLEPERVLAGRAVDASGRPVADALVRLEGERLVVFDDVDFGERTTWEWVAGTNESRTDEDGRFRFDGLHDAEFDVIVRPPDAPELFARTRARSGREDLEVVVDRAALERLVLAGRVTDAATGEPLDGFVLSVTTPDGTGRTHAIERAQDGRFRRAGLEPGTYALSVHAPGYARWRREARAYGTGETVLDVALVPSCIVQLVQGGYRPWRMSSNALVRFEALDGSPLSIEHGFGGTSTAAYLGTEPTVVAGLPRGPIRLRATSHGCRELVLELDLSHPPAEPIVLELERDADALPAELQLGVFLTARPELAGAHDFEDEDALGTLRTALERGELEPPAVPVEIELLDAAGARVARATVEPVQRGEPLRDYRWTVSPVDGEPSSGESLHGPGLDATVPARARTAIVRAPGCRDERIELALDPDRSRTVAVVLLRVGSR